MNSLLEGLWSRLNTDTIGTERYWKIALQNAAFYADMKPLLAKYARGRMLLDVGAGRLAWRHLLKKDVDCCISGDIHREHPELDVLFDATKALPFADESFDCVFCCSVLEHTTAPRAALAEMRRVLKRNGVVILSVPFLFYLHGQPHDYFRFSKYGVIHLATSVGLEPVEMLKHGGIFHLILNLPSVVISTLAFSLRLYPLVELSTSVWRVFAKLLDGQLDKEGLFATGHIFILRKTRSD